MQEPIFSPLTENQIYDIKNALSQKLDFVKTVYELASEEKWFADMFGISQFDAGILSCEIFQIQEKIFGYQKILEERIKEQNGISDKRD